MKADGADVRVDPLWKSLAIVGGGVEVDDQVQNLERRWAAFALAVGKRARERNYEALLAAWVQHGAPLFVARPCGEDHREQPGQAEKEADFAE